MAGLAEDLPAELQAQFTQLRQQFVVGLAARWLRINQANSARNCHAELHRLAGAAGGYGFTSLGLAARNAMQRFPAPDHDAYPPDWTVLSEELRTAMCEAGALLGP